jgi:hypothetical protein
VAEPIASPLSRSMRLASPAGFEPTTSRLGGQIASAVWPPSWRPQHFLSSYRVLLGMAKPSLHHREALLN